MSKTVHVLLIEDNEVDVEAVLRAFRLHRIANPVIRACDGIEALELLRGTNGRPRLPRPYLILLDIKLPRMNGIEFMRSLRTDPELADSVVFVLTTSRSDEDKLATYDLHAAGYMVKDNVGGDFLRLVDLLDRYWRVVELPPERTA